MRIQRVNSIDRKVSRKVEASQNVSVQRYRMVQDHPYYVTDRIAWLGPGMRLPWLSVDGNALLSAFRIALTHGDSYLVPLSAYESRILRVDYTVTLLVLPLAPEQPGEASDAPKARVAFLQGYQP